MRVGGRVRTAALCGGYFLVLLDVTVVNVTLPSIGSELHMSGGGLAWVVDAYTVPLAALLLAAGALGDRLGHRPLVLAGFAGFGAASVVCASAPVPGVLVAGRAVQGACAALLLPGTLALLAGAAPDDRSRTRVVGLWAAVGGAALPAGPLVGGVLADLAGWRSVFWLNVPLTCAALAVLARVREGAPLGAGGPTPTKPPDADGRTGTSRPGAGVPAGRTDWAGAVTLAVALGAGVGAVIEAPRNLTVSLVAAAVAVGAVPVLRAVERRAEAPLLGVPGPARGPLRAACAVAGLMNLTVLGSLFLLTQLFQDVRGASPLEAGLMLLPGLLPLPLLGNPAGRLTGRIGAWRTAALGLAIGAVGFAGIAVAADRPHGAAAHALLVCALLVWGSGLGILTPAIVSAALLAVPDNRQGMASGASNTARQSGGALGVAVFAAAAGDATAGPFASRSALLLAASAAAFALTAAYALRRARD